jgi:hypothetical protein
VKQILTLLLSVAFLAHLNAQRGWEVGGWLGVSHYFGDLNTEYRLDRFGGHGGAGARLNANSRICLMLSANYSSVSAYDSDAQNIFERARNLHFRSEVLDATLQLEFNFLPYIHGSREEFYTPYMFAGLSVVNFDPEAEYKGEWVSLQTYGTEGQFFGDEYSRTTGAFTIGGGFKVDLSYEWSLNFNVGSRLLFTDYIDDVSGAYPDFDELENLRGRASVELSDRSVPGDLFESSIGRTGQQRGDGKGSDHFMFFHIGLMYYFGDIRCPPMSRRF